MRVVKLLRFYSLALIFSLDNGKLNRTHLSICNLLILNPRIMPPLRGSIYFFSFSRGSASYEAPPPGYLMPPHPGLMNQAGIRPQNFCYCAVLSENLWDTCVKKRICEGGKAGLALLNPFAELFRPGAGDAGELGYFFGAAGPEVWHGVETGKQQFFALGRHAGVGIQAALAHAAPHQ